MHLPIILRDVQPLQRLNKGFVSSRLLLAQMLGERANEVIRSCTSLRDLRSRIFESDR